MKTLGTITISFLALVTISGSPQTNGWRGLVPLHSTRADFERVLGAPKESRGVAATYETKDETVRVFYSDGICKKGNADDWNVPRDTVLRFTVHPNSKLLVDDLQIDKTKYDRRNDPHLQGVVYYINKSAGIFVDARKLEGTEEVVDNITYMPAEADNNLRCNPRPGSNGNAINEGTPDDGHLRKFDEFGKLAPGDENARLDNFAIYLLKNEPKFKAYVIVYAPGTTIRTSKAKAHAQRLKSYLIKVRRLSAKRIVAIDGGCRDHLEVELYALPASISPPTPNPYCGKRWN